LRRGGGEQREGHLTFSGSLFTERRKTQHCKGGGGSPKVRKGGTWREKTPPTKKTTPHPAQKKKKPVKGEGKRQLVEWVGNYIEESVVLYMRGYVLREDGGLSKRGVTVERQCERSGQ